MALELRQLRQVLAIAQHGSLGRAAASLHMTQPALSRSLKLIESEIGSVLFERSASGVTPTEQGRLVIRRARELVDAADDLDREVVRQRVGGTGQVNVGAGPYAAETVLSSALATFLPRNELVQVRVTIRGNFDELPRLLRSRQLDFFVAEYSTFAGYDDLDVQPMERHQGFFVARRDHPLAGRRFAPEELFQYPFVGLAHYPARTLQPLLALRQPVDARRPARPFPAMESVSVPMAKKILLGSDAIAGLLLPMVADDIKRGSLVVLGTAPWCYAHYGLISLKGHTQGDAAARLIRELWNAEARLVEEEARLEARLVRKPLTRGAGAPRRFGASAARSPRPS